MKRIILLCLLAFTGIASYASSVITDSTFLHTQILNGIQSANYIFEGEVIQAESYFNEEENYIYTSSIVKVIQSWKTDETSQFSDESYVEVITRGGTVGNTSLTISHNLGFSPGQKGMFFCMPAIDYPAHPSPSIPHSQSLQVYDGLYFDYDYSLGYARAKYVNINYECVELLYEAIDSSYVAECIEVIPNGALQTLYYNQLIAEANTRAAGATAGVGTITYSIENAITTRSNGQNFFEFDIYLSSTANVYFFNGLVRLEYNTQAFGSDIVANNKITCQRGSLTASVNDYHTPAPGDLSANTIAIPINSITGAQNQSLLTSTPEQALHIKIEIQNCQHLPEIEFEDQNAMLLLSLYTTSPSGTTLNDFANIDATDTENSPLCQMSITDFSPKDVIGGIGDIVTVDGHFFGNFVQGKVELTNADDGGISWVELNENDIISWTDNQIQFYVPANIHWTNPLNSNIQKKKTPGTGKIKVIANGGSNVQSNQDLTISYSRHDYQLFNTNSPKIKTFLSGEDQVPNILSSGSELGYSFELNPNITSNQGAVDCINQAVDDWVCATEIRWNVSSTVATHAAVRDNISTIQFGQMDNSGSLAETAIWRLACADANGGDMAYSHDIDIVINNQRINDFIYDQVGTQMQPAGKFDFYSVILHELGHGHLFKHTNDFDDLMYYEAKHDASNDIPSFDRSIYFSNANLAGGISIVQESVLQDFSNCASQDPMIALPKQNCSVNLVSNRTVTRQNQDHQLTIYPNPFSASFSLQIPIEFITEKLTLTISDINGTIYTQKELSIHNREAERIEIDGSFMPSGLYLLQLSNGKHAYHTKMIKL